MNAQNLKNSTTPARPLSFEDEPALITACVNSDSPALHPLVITAIDGGLRAAEQEALRHRDLRRTIKQGVIVDGEIVVSNSKTKGENRVIPLTPRLCAALTIWLRRFPKARGDAYIFPRHEFRQAKRAWRTVQKAANVNYHWHDLRYTFITRLLRSPVRQSAGAGCTSATEAERARPEAVIAEGTDG